jgi:hypothetical protein
MDISHLIELRGNVDRLDATAIDGWITVVDAPEKKVPLDILLNGRMIGQCVADKYRRDLDEAGLAGGQCAFTFAMPAFLPAGALANVALRITNSPVLLDLPAPQAPASPTVSRFGGLWIDRVDFIDRLAEKHRSGIISDTVSDQLTHFVRDGYVILPAAVAPKTLARLNAEIERVWQHPPAGLMIETFEPDGVMRYIPPDLRFREGTTKLLDLYTVSPAAREAIAPPAALSFLTALFEGPPKAFQGATFWNGSQQPIHKDTAYVKVDSNPLHLAASWLALEDVCAGSGELECYAGSHRAPDFLFGGTSKWMEAHGEDHPAYLASLHADAEKYGHVKKIFAPKAGDLLISHADLAHGGAPITAKAKTRRSLVTHFCPATDEPFYRRTAKFAGKEENGLRFISQYGNIR